MRGDPPGDAGDAYARLDGDAGPVVRSFAITGGRTRAGAEFDLLAHVVATESGILMAGGLLPEQREIIGRATRPISVAELAGHLNRPVGVIQVLLSDLHDLDAITIDSPEAAADLPGDHILNAVIDGLRSL